MATIPKELMEEIVMEMKLHHHSFDCETLPSGYVLSADFKYDIEQGEQVSDGDNETPPEYDDSIETYEIFSLALRASDKDIPYIELDAREIEIIKRELES